MSRDTAAVGQSQWQLVWSEFSKRKLALVSAGVIFLLIQTAIWAPFLANDRPVYYRGTNPAKYESSAQNCQGALVKLTEHRRKKQPSPEPADAISALKLHLELMTSSLVPDDAHRLTEWSRKLQAAQAEPDSKAAIRQLTELRKELSETLSARRVTLRPVTRWPVAAALTGWDAFFLAWSVLTILSPGWRLLLQRLPANSNRIMIGLFVWLGIPVIISGLWFWLVPPREDLTKYKQGRLAAAESSGEFVPVVYQTVVWPPVPYSLSEIVLEKKYQRPPWYSTAKQAAAAAPNGKSSASSPWDVPHWLGTDSLGRDALARMIWGSRVSLSVGFVSVTIYVALGILIGALAGFFRGIVDLVISRFIEIVICFPTFFLILTIVALRGPSIWNIMVVIGLTGWTGVARLIRAEFLRLVDQEFVLAGRALGYSPARLIFRHVLPNALAPVLVSATFGVGGAILTESALSYLGLGITIPIPSWGSLLLDGRNSDGVAPWLILLPGLAIFLTITCYNLVGEALRDASDPRLRGSRN